MTNTILCKHFTRYVLSLSCFIFIWVTASAQQPGGVSGTKVWYVSVQKGSKVIYRDISGNNWDSLNGSSTVRVINFHPAAMPTTATLDLKNLAFNQATVVSIYYPKSTHNPADNPNFYQANYNTQTINLKKQTVDFGSDLGKISYNPTLISSSINTAMKAAFLYQATKKNYTSIWGEDKKTSVKIDFTGYMPELIIYNRLITPLERSKVETYLAIKYGITLDSSYIGSNGDVLWDIKNPVFNRFHNRVCGIGKDKLAGLWQPKSNTTYEESSYTAFDYDSYNTAPTKTNYEFISKLDTPSLYRSITIGFSDKTMQNVKDATYVMWGDDDSDLTLKKDSSYPGLEKISRIWFVHNPARQSEPLKIVISGKSYEEKKTLFERIYKRHDYQFYRYVLLKLNSINYNKIDSLVLNNSFGREQPKVSSKNTFNTRSIVWDKLICNEKENHFTIGRVPLLSFWVVGKLEGKKFDSVTLRYQYLTNLPITTSSNNDVVVYKFKVGDTLKLKINCGIGTTQLRYKNISSSQWTIYNYQQINDLQSEESEETITTATTSDDEESQATTSNDTPGFITKSLRKGFRSEYYKISGFLPEAKYTIEIKDSIGQVATLNIELKSQTTN